MPLLDMNLARDGNICFWTSSVGRKLLMAVTGFVFIGFVTIHMLGNLTAYMGRESMNAYAAFLQGMAHGGGIWIFRVIMLTLILVHICTAISLTLDNWAARPEGYRKQCRKSATWASLSMRYTACILAVFIVYHLLHLTVGWSQVHPSFVHSDAYGNFIKGFQNWPVSVFYIIAILCLGLHIWHGIWSFSQTLGWAHPRYNTLRRHVATIWSLIIVCVNISYPIAVLSGILI
ncbi:MAG: succinate dehydrogenase cytochrome b subunit [Holophagales bacterium]|jgi:succinate dehydrogenase / fumarate reductase cytochrome b subunit|nr:succinate dehydrogenase cytochrome b subunit [Holophagales bacterium]